MTNKAALDRSMNCFPFRPSIAPVLGGISAIIAMAVIIAGALTA